MSFHYFKEEFNLGRFVKMIIVKMVMVYRLKIVTVYRFKIVIVFLLSPERSPRFYFVLEKVKLCKSGKRHQGLSF